MNKGSGGTKKYGRNATNCKNYRLRNKHEKSHIRRIERHIRTYKDSSSGTKKALKKYKDLLIKHKD